MNKEQTKEAIKVMQAFVESYRGTNKLVWADGIILTTTAPIEIIAVEKIK